LRLAVAQGDGDGLGIVQQEAPLRVPELLYVAQLCVAPCQRARHVEFTVKLETPLTGCATKQIVVGAPVDQVRVEVIDQACAGVAGTTQSYRHACVGVVCGGREQGEAAGVDVVK